MPEERVRESLVHLVTGMEVMPVMPRSGFFGGVWVGRHGRREPGARGQRLNRRPAGSYSSRGESARKTQRWHVKPGGRWSCRVAFVIITSPHQALRTPGGWSLSDNSRCAW